MVSPERKRQAVLHVQCELEVSERRACTTIRHLLEDRFVQGQLRDQLLEPAVFLLQFLEPFHGLFLRSAIFLPPPMVGRRTDFQLLADFLHALASRQKRGRLAQLLDDLFGCVSFAFHVESSAALTRRQLS